MALVSVVVPVYYNAESLASLTERLTSVAAAASKNDFEFLFVDDGSGDASFDVLQHLVEEDARVRIIKLSRNFGTNAAILAGLTYASGDCVAVISADLQDPPELIAVMLQKWINGAKVVLAARQGREDPLSSRLFANLYYWLFRRLALKDMPRQGFDFFLIDRQVVDLLVHFHERNAYLMGLVLWTGFDREVIHYRRRKREKGKSRWTLAKKFKYFIDGFVSFSYFPIRLASFLGVALAFVGFIYALVVLLLKFLQDIPVQGWTSLMVVLLIVSGVQLILLGIFGEYLWRNFEETRRRPPFIVDQVIGIEKTDAEEAALKGSSIVVEWDGEVVLDRHAL
jgi:dolichol-phosphate mannosyltransferase